MTTAPSQPTASAQEAKQETTEQPVTVVAGPGEVHYDDMKTHNKDNDCWMAIHGKVYDVTKFLNDHPGGAEVMLEVAGQDATVQFDDIGHSEKAKQQIVEKCIFKGKLVGAPENLGRAGAGHSGGVGVSQVMLPIVGMVLLAYAVQTLM